LEILKKRYPNLSFLLNFFPKEPAPLLQDSQAFEEWLNRNCLNGIEVVYCIGLPVFTLPKRLMTWLEEKKECALVFVEEALGAIANFPQKELLENPQIHLYHGGEGSIEQLSRDFPTDRLLIYEGRPFDTLSLKRQSASLSAAYSDLLYSHKIVDNVLTHFQRLEHCFDARGSFANLPAVICGAGPSLEKDFSTLKKLHGRALLIAGGSAIPILSRQGIRPHLAMALDPNDEEFDRLRQSTYFEGPFLFAPRLQKEVFATTNGPFGYLKTDTGGLIENFLEKKVGLSGEAMGPDLGAEAFSVTTLAVAYAYALGCNPIILTGVDLCYQKHKRYAPGVEADPRDLSDPRALEKSLTRKDIHGNEVETLLKWVMEAEAISAFAKEHPDREWIYASQGGLGMEGIQNLRLEVALEGKKTEDIEGRIHAWIQSSPLVFDKEKRAGQLLEIEDSLKRCEKLCGQILSEASSSGKRALFESDFYEETAYSSLLEGIDKALDHLLVRYYPHIDEKQALLERERAKYLELQRQIGKFLEIFSRLQKYPASL
jgi:hypothetical protein